MPITIEEAVKRLTKIYEKEEWFIGIKTSYEKDSILMYVSCTPDVLGLPASWKQIPLHVIKKNKGYIV